MQISDFGIFSDVLIYRIRWDDPAVIRECDIMLDPDLPRVKIWL